MGVVVELVGCLGYCSTLHLLALVFVLKLYPLLFGFALTSLLRLCFIKIEVGVYLVYRHYVNEPGGILSFVEVHEL